MHSGLNKKESYGLKTTTRVSESTRKISFEKSATQFALRLGAGTPEVVREAEAFVSNIPFTAETPSMAG